MKIVLDAMGGDYAPYEVLHGAQMAEKEIPDIQIILVGHEPTIKSLIDKDFPDLRCEIVHAPESIEMGESPAISVRKKRNSSIVVGLNLLKERKAGAFVSLGNTGAVVCAATLGLRMIPGVDRPGIGTTIPTLKGPAFIIDVGANIEPKPKHLQHYAVMASVYSRIVLEKKDTVIGLLNIGEEESKGSGFHKEVFGLLKNVPGFIGNIEAKHMFNGDCDCIITDGIIGNVALKVGEATAETIGELLRRQVKGNLLAMFGLPFFMPSLRGLKKKMDYAEYGGAPLLGVDGVVIIGHGRSKAKAVMNALKAGYREMNENINQYIQKEINSYA
jgi:glycerol-3-phosphate acyltransferase PlsX